MAEGAEGPEAKSVEAHVPPAVDSEAPAAPEPLQEGSGGGDEQEESDADEEDGDGEDDAKVRVNKREGKKFLSWRERRKDHREKKGRTKRKRRIIPDDELAREVASAVPGAADPFLARSVAAADAATASAGDDGTKPQASGPEQADDGKVSVEEKRQQREARKAAEIKNFEARCAQGATVIIDCEFDDLMNEKEAKCLVQQFPFCYGTNRSALRPVSFVLSGLAENSRAMGYLKKQSGFPHAWPGMRVQEQAYIETYSSEEDRARLCYLTADADEVLDHIDPSRIYIIGGVVDHNRLKGLTKCKAMEQGIAAARLPLEEHMEMGSFSRVLAINHVAHILIHQQYCNNWRETFDKCVPGRKRFLDQAGDGSAPVAPLTKKQRRRQGCHINQEPRKSDTPAEPGADPAEEREPGEGGAAEPTAELAEERAPRESDAAEPVAEPADQRTADGAS